MTTTRAMALGGLAALGVAAWLGLPATSQQASSLEALAVRAATLERDIARLEDVNAIKQLQRIYGFYTDKQLWSEAADLFATDGEIEVVMVAGRARGCRSSGWSASDSGASRSRRGSPRRPGSTRRA